MSGTRQRTLRDVRRGKAPSAASSIAAVRSMRRASEESADPRIRITIFDPKKQIE
jgi:hypothetical protein